MLNIVTTHSTGKNVYALIAQATSTDGAGVLSFYDTTADAMIATSDAGFVFSQCGITLTEDAVVGGRYATSINPNITGAYTIYTYERIGGSPATTDTILGVRDVYYTYAEGSDGGTESTSPSQTLLSQTAITDRIDAGTLTEFQNRQLNTIYNRVLRDNSSSGL